MICIDYVEECIFWYVYGGFDFFLFIVGGMIQEIYGQYIVDEGGVDDGVGVFCKDLVSWMVFLLGLICWEMLKK